MEKKYIRAESKRNGRRIQGLLANDDGRTVYIIQDGEPFYCMHELYDFYEIDINWRVIRKYERTNTSADKQ